MPSKCSLRVVVLAGSLLLPHGAAGQEAAQDRIIGAISPTGGAYLVKHFGLPKGTVIAGLEFVSNDPGTVFPRVSVLRGPARTLREATSLVEMTDVPSVGGLVHIAFPPIVLDAAQDIYVAVALPPSDGVRGAGAGAGIAAKQLESPGSSYFAAGEDWRFGQMDVEYAIDLLHRTARKPSSGPERPAAAPRVADAQVRPNPFNPAVAIELSVPRAAQVQVDIYDIGGRLVRALLRAKLEPGVHHQGWDGRDDRGQPSATGIYLAKVRIGDTLVTRKLALLR